MEKWIVERAKLEDREFIAQFQVKMAKETENLELDINTVLKGAQHIFENESEGFYLVVRNPSDGTVIGSTLVLKEWSDWRCRHVWWIHSVYVAPEYRKRGVFRAIYEHLKEQVNADEGLAGLRLYVDKTNLGAQKTYQKVGMDDQHYSLFEWLK